MFTCPRYVPVLLRSLLGAAFVLFGLDGFLGFLPQPALPPAAGAFVGALAATGYMFPLIKTVELLGGALLVAGRAVPLALVLLAPVVVNIIAFTWALAPVNPAGWLVFLGELTLLWVYRRSFLGLLARTVA